MVTKASKAAETKAPKPKRKLVASFPEAADPDKAAAIAKMALRPSVNAAAVMVSYTKALGEVDLAALVNSLSDSMNEMRAGDMKRTESMLYGERLAAPPC